MRALLQSRMRLFAATCLAAVLCLAAGAAAAQGLVPVPPLSSPVTDLTGTLTADQRAALEAKLLAFSREKGSQVAVLIVPTTQPEEIEQYSIRVVEAWRLGREQQDDGALLLVALQDRKVRIEVGHGLEGALPDATANRIIDEHILPAFRRGDFYGGISTGIDRVLRVIEGEQLPAPEIDSPSAGIPGLFDSLPFLFIAALIVAPILRRLFGRLGGSFAAGGMVGFVVWLLVGVLGIALAAGIIAFIFFLMGGGGGGPGSWSSRRHGSGWGYPGGFGGGFGGGGGFSGGGGSFGGGGASGGW